MLNRLSDQKLSVTRTLCLRVRALLCSVLLGMGMTACLSNAGAFKTYVGELGSSVQAAVIRGGQLVRSDLMNRYVDVVCFLRVDEVELKSGEQVAAVEVVPGLREIEVYYSWDHGSQRGLGAALVDYAASQTSVSSVLRFNAQAGETYTVRAEPTFKGERRDITTLSYVDFWIEDAAGSAVVPTERAFILPKVSVN